MADIAYAKTVDGSHVAYSVVGAGDVDVVYAGGFTISIDSYDDEPHVAHMWRRIASTSSGMLSEAASTPPIESDSRALVMRYLHPAALGRQLWRGFRQSIPSSM